MDALLSRDEVSGHDFIYGELLIGDRAGEAAAGRLRAHAPGVPHDYVVAFMRERGLHGRGVGWIDGHLPASALVGRLKLWTTDPRLATLAKELGFLAPFRTTTDFFKACKMRRVEFYGTIVEVPRLDSDS